VRIRPARSADVAAIEALVEGAYGHYVERIGMRPGPMNDDYAEKVGDGFAFVAEEGEIVGLLVLIPQPGYLLIDNLAVEPSRQGEGIGISLLEFAEEAARTAGLTEVQLYTHHLMSENLAFYPKRGYRETKRLTERGFARVFFAKVLR
jgi:N-acetylglutamate synthase-like GNAT family acetyltransferase